MGMVTHSDPVHFHVKAVVAGLIIDQHLPAPSGCVQGHIPTVTNFMLTLLDVLLELVVEEQPVSQYCLHAMPFHETHGRDPHSRCGLYHHAITMTSCMHVDEK